ncbi:TetR/AcrR family transcriptional regulator [Burkholderia gladioli]|uniref:TetR/AcrR family transcriptional regulator n=1 Tax=Burkholderia gladioli TaxID=28095 RepID=UPI001640BE66|nr:TetR family transcriptional regulator [Burkholderia gladioli]
MVKKRGPQRRKESLSRDQIIEAAIALLDSSGESGLTFRALSEQLATGPGAIYWHITDKSDLLVAACDAIVARTLDESSAQATPDKTIRALALDMFDAMDAHPWVGSALARASGQLPALRILERIGQQVRALGVPEEEQWATASALLNYILGVGGQNADKTQFARTHSLDRPKFLEAVSATWSQLDPDKYPFARSVVGRLPDHDDRMDFLTGIDLILRGLQPDA